MEPGKALFEFNFKKISLLVANFFHENHNSIKCCEEIWMESRSIAIAAIIA
jgi:hypothetical protein